MIDEVLLDAGHACSTSQLVVETEDGGDSWEPIGIDFSGSEFFDLQSVAADDVNVASGAGIIYRYDGFRWTPHVVADGGLALGRELRRRRVGGRRRAVTGRASAAT